MATSGHLLASHQADMHKLTVTSPYVKVASYNPNVMLPQPRKGNHLIIFFDAPDLPPYPTSEFGNYLIVTHSIKQQFTVRNKAGQGIYTYNNHLTLHLGGEQGLPSRIVPRLFPATRVDRGPRHSEASQNFPLSTSNGI